jgi:hypothetical protein
MTKIEIELSDATAKAAHAAGLLTPHALDRLLNDALRRKAGHELLEVVRRIHAAGSPPMTDDEIVAEVKTARAERRNEAAANG